MICVIPARGGSTRIPHKNRKVFHGRPIILYSIETAKRSGLFTEIVVSTDDPEIFELATQHGATGYIRPESLAKNEVGTQEVAQDVLKQVTDEYACVLYATSPLLTVDDLSYGYKIMMALYGNYHYTYSCDENGVDAGSFYFGRTKSFVDGIPLEGNSACIKLPPSRVCDINTPEDWDQAEAMYGVMNGH